MVRETSLKLNTKYLNECLQNIPTKYTDLFVVMIQFRIHKIAVAADIKNGFSSVGNNERQGDSFQVL